MKMQTIWKENGSKSEGNVELGTLSNRPWKKETLSEGQLNHHVHVVGATGFGKTVFLSHIIKNRIERGDA